MICPYLVFGRYSSMPCLQVGQKLKKNGVKTASNYDRTFEIVQGFFFFNVFLFQVLSNEITLDNSTEHL